jgi:uncharacterized protein (DUF885 family)
MRIVCGVLVVVFAALVPAGAQQQAAATNPELATLIEQAQRVRDGDWAPILAGLDRINYAALDLDDQIDFDLLRSHARTRQWEQTELKLWEVNAAGVINLGSVSGLFLREGALPDVNVRAAIATMKALPESIRANRARLTTPARTWTENAQYQAYYARQMLETEVSTLEISSPALRAEFLAAASEAAAAVREHEQWLETELLPRSTRPPTWTPDQIEVYQFVHEQLDGYGVDEMIRIAEAEDRKLWSEMEALAARIHPSGDLRTVWEVMKNEAPPWEEVIPMAQRYVDMASDWLRGSGQHVVSIPSYLRYGARLSPPMARRTLSFGGATSGPTIDGQQSGFYILTPLEDRLTEEEKRSRLKSYNPYWTHVISYHEWLGHTVQIASARANVTRPMRRIYNSIYFSQAWSFYLEKLFEDEGYFDTLPHMENLKTRMARRQMRMWRVQRILTKLKMAKGEMTFDQAVTAYVERIGMEPANAFIEVQRDSQSPSPPGREIIGELMILKLRDEVQSAQGPAFSLKAFHDDLISHGALTFAQIRRLMLQEPPR